MDTAGPVIEDVLEPLARYRDEYQAKFAHLAREKFADLVEAAKIDINANRALASRVHALEASTSRARGWKRFWTFLAILGLLAVAAAVAVVCLYEGGAHSVRQVRGYCLLGGGLGVVLAIFAFMRRSRASDRLETLEKHLARNLEQAWAQMAPLNALYSWDLVPKLVEATVPRLAFDPFFSARRLADLKRLYGWDDSLNKGRSVVYAQSGVINGNPFLFGDLMEMNWGVKTYSGSITIYWTEEERDSEGRVHTVRRSQVLTAHVTKPIPEYGRRKILVYGNDAAPDLKFTHQPNPLSSAGDGIWTRMRKRRQLRKLEKYSQNLDDDSQFTLMANHEFETLFNTPNRNDEVQYRLLFTALAQQQMLELMKDTSVGYGDDFTFDKCFRINLLRSRHLDDATIDTDPRRFHHWELDVAARNFYAFSEQYFKDVYFALAPVLAIPLYQQTRTHEDIWKGVLPDDRASFWEHESLANYYGEEHFCHPQCVTHSILKTSSVTQPDGSSHVQVTAYGYRAEDRVDYFEMLGGDGDYHTVPVHWEEYLPVRNTSMMRVCESPADADNHSSAFDAAFSSSGSALFRRAIRSFLFD